MIEFINPYSGANFSYTGENCTANGDYKVENGVLKHIGIAGSYTKDGDTYAFTAGRDESANIVIAGVPVVVLADVAQAVTVIVAEVEAAVAPANEEE